MTLETCWVSELNGNIPDTKQEVIRNRLSVWKQASRTDGQIDREVQGFNPVMERVM
jgi:hypothetical protein